MAVTPASLSGIAWLAGYVDSMRGCRLGQWLKGSKELVGYQTLGIAMGRRLACLADGDPAAA